jgi:hypothetical protein
MFAVGYHALRMKSSAFGLPKGKRTRVIKYFGASYFHWPLFGLKSMGKPSNELGRRGSVALTALNIEEHLNLKRWAFIHTLRKIMEDPFPLIDRIAGN